MLSESTSSPSPGDPLSLRLDIDLRRVGLGGCSDELYGTFVISFYFPLQVFLFSSPHRYRKAPNQADLGPPNVLDHAPGLTNAQAIPRLLDHLLFLGQVPNPGNRPLWRVREHSPGGEAGFDADHSEAQSFRFYGERASVASSVRIFSINAMGIKDQGSRIKERRMSRTTRVNIVTST